MTTRPSTAPAAAAAAAAARLRSRAEAHLRQQKQSALTPSTPEDLQRLLHELQVHQIELEMQSDELRLARQQVDGIVGESQIIAIIQTHTTSNESDEPTENRRSSTHRCHSG